MNIGPFYIGTRHQYKGLHTGDGVYDIIRICFKAFPRAFDDYVYFQLTVLGVAIFVGKKR